MRYVFLFLFFFCVKKPKVMYKIKFYYFYYRDCVCEEYVKEKAMKLNMNNSSMINLYAEDIEDNGPMPKSIKDQSVVENEPNQPVIEEPVVENIFDKQTELNITNTVDSRTNENSVDDAMFENFTTEE